ncbi:exodeoxyribonuclease VII large subunit [Aliivibrio fischeri]|uniref:exodeoxyribonuclease VII large subunit n=1 Tax=Aliivibrio fischeri TaxID=668 RepID=UPI0012D8F602|nr:exodeoxyribonuclease VII large subunit [Aliivibrio fischeri]MUK92479.1 exodeoxyribonuclease VII large subunit [Aliivibrio fischeri]
MSLDSNPRIFTVSRLNAEVRLLLENEMGIVWLVGEISNLTVPVSGHWYLTLKDSQAQVKCAMFKGNNRRVTFKPQNGKQVLVKARLSLYEPRGDYQLIIESMQPEGDGRLQQEFDQLKMSLAAEGLFAQTAKKSLPEQPKRVGIITSQTGAALFDILHVLKRRDPNLPVVIYPTMVQGSGAAIQIAQAIGRANSRNECDILIVGRGGGSLEDLWCFNEEIVARTIAASEIPIVSAVGHEIDVTIADFVADVRAPTPSAAAELVSRDLSAQLQTVAHQKRRLNSAMERYLSHQQRSLSAYQHRIEKQHPQMQLNNQSQRLDDLNQRLMNHIQQRLQRQQYRVENLTLRLNNLSPTKRISQDKLHIEELKRRLLDSMDRNLLMQRHQLALAAEKLDTVSPLATLMRGYSITHNQDGKIITSTKQVELGDNITTRFADGDITSTVTKASELN